MPKFLLILLFSSLSLGARAELPNDTPEELEKKVAAGDTAAMCELGNRLLRGRNMGADIPRGKELVTLSAEKGNADCQYYLGLMYKDGRWFSWSPERAMSWFNKAAEKGVAGAQIELGLAYEKGLGDIKDPPKAAPWYQRAARKGHAVGMFHYGRLLVQDAERAAEGRAWLQMASEKGDYDAQTLLGSLPALEGSNRLLYERALIYLRSSLPKS